MIYITDITELQYNETVFTLRIHKRIFRVDLESS